MNISTVAYATAQSICFPNSCNILLVVYFGKISWMTFLFYRRIMGSEF